MKLKSILLVAAMFISSLWFIKAQESEEPNQFDVSFQFRPRAEYRNGYKYPRSEGDLKSGLVTQRSRLSLDYRREILSAALSLQNVSIWGQYPHSNTNQSNIAIYEAWAQLKSSEGLFAKFGRQVLHYNDGRLISVANWNQASRAHDALKFGYQTNLHQLDAVLAYNQHRDRPGGGTYYDRSNGIPYKTMQLLYYQNNQIRNFTPSFIFINVGLEEGVEPESKLAYTQTVGTNLIYKPTDELRLTGIGYYQMGKRVGLDENISAYFLGLKGEYNVSDQVKVTAATEFMSGEDYNSPNPNDSFNAFSVLYGGNHGLYGVMDYFVDVPYNTGMNLGIWDNFLNVSYKPAQKYTLGLTYHYFLTASDVYDGAEKLSRGLGSEIDLQFDYSIRKDVNLSAGYSTYFGTPTMDFVKGGDHKVWQDWAYVMITVNPRVFSAKW